MKLKPEPKPVKTICSVCELDWGLHKSADVSECIRLLKIEAARTTYVPQPYPVYPMVPADPWPYRRIWYSQGVTTTRTCGNVTAGGDYRTVNAIDVESCTLTPSAVEAA